MSISFGPIYKRKFGQQKHMHLVQNSVQIHQLLLTQLSLINRIGGSIIQKNPRQNIFFKKQK